MSRATDVQISVHRFRETLSQVIRGKAEAIDLLLIGVLAKGHVLLEDVPGVGKTTLAKAMARCFDMGFSRVQFTPDLLPADIVGSQILDPRDGSFSFHRGPVFTNVLLADEINRASPRTQSALLEAMNESQATVEGHTHPLPEPFFVLATQNPVDFQGTYPLPEAQLDRFLLRFELGYPDPESELQVLFDRQKGDALQALEPVCSADRLLEMQQEVCDVHVARDVAQYMLRVVEATRHRPQIQLGVSTRGALALFRAAQARAYVQGREFVSPVDIKELAVSVFGHRIMLTSEARYGGATPVAVLTTLLDEIEVPV